MLLARKSHLFRQLILAAILLAGIQSATAQNPTQAVDRAQLLRAQPTLRDEPATDGDDEETVAASPNDPDLGEQAILKRSERYRAFTVYASVPLSYTSNVALSRTGEQEDLLFTPNVGFAWAPKLTSNLYGNISLGQQFFEYDEFSELNFGSLDMRAGFTYIVPQLRNLLLRADYAYNRLTSDGYHEFFWNHSLNFAAEMPFRIGRAQQISVGFDTSFSIDASQPVCRLLGERDACDYAHRSGTGRLARVCGRRSLGRERDSGVHGHVSLYSLAERKRAGDVRDERFEPGRLRLRRGEPRSRALPRRQVLGA
jgi:hypothetical protein